MKGRLSEELIMKYDHHNHGISFPGGFRAENLNVKKSGTTDVIMALTS